MIAGLLPLRIAAAVALAWGAIAAVAPTGGRMMRREKREGNVRMQFIGHRGASAVHPENTLKAVRGALAVDAGFEVDLQLLKDGEVIVLHDDTLSRTAAIGWISWMLGLDAKANEVIRQPVRQLDLTQAQTVKVGDSSHSEPVPTFATVLRELHEVPQPMRDGDDSDHRRHLAHCFAELKAFGYHSGARHDPELTKEAAAAVTKAKVSPSQLTWISFSLSALVDIKRRLPDHKAYLIAYVSTPEEAFAVARLAVDSGMDGIDLNADNSVVNTELVEWLHARGKEIAVWVWKAPGSNDKESVWAHMEQCGVDFFTSNLPPALDGWRARHAQHGHRHRDSARRSAPKS